MMTEFDRRSGKERSMDFTFYVFDDLLAQRKGNDSHLYRFDTLEEAVAKFHELPKEMRTAIGFSNCHKSSELDLIHRVEGEPVFVKDFLNATSTSLDPRIHEFALKLCENLKIEWEMDSMLGNSILVPREYGTSQEHGSAVHNSYFDNKRLDYLVWDEDIGRRIPHKGGPKMAIQEAYLQNAGNIGYVSRKNLMDMVDASQDGYLNEQRPKVSSFYINYIDTKGNFFGADVSPHTLRELLQREKYFEPDLFTWKHNVKALEALAVELDQFSYEYDFYTYWDNTIELPGCGMDRAGNVHQILQDLTTGKASSYRSFLTELIADEDNGPWSQVAGQLLNKLDAAFPEKARCLEQILSDAKETETSRIQQNLLTKTPDGKERE